MKFYHIAALSSLVLSAPVAAQSVETEAAAAAPAVATILTAPTENVLRVGAPIALRMNEELTTKGKKLKVGQRFNLETAEAITLNGMIVIPAGSPAVGEVTDVRNKGMWGKSGKINARMLYVRVGDRQIRLSGQVDDKGVTGTAGVVGALAIAPIAGFFMTGTSANIPVGAPVRAFLDEDVVIAVAAPAPVQPVPELALAEPAAIPAATPAPLAAVAAPVPQSVAPAAVTRPAPMAATPTKTAVIKPAAARPLRVYPTLTRPAAPAPTNTEPTTSNNGVIIQ